MENISILIVDDHKLIRESWKAILSADRRFNVVAVCGNGDEGADLAIRLRPDVVLMDINLPGIDGIEATELIGRMSSQIKILAASLHTEPEYAEKMFKAGAMGYITKNSSTEELYKAVIEVHQGQKYLCEEIQNKISK